MIANDRNSNRKLLIQGNGWFIGKIPLKYIGRHSCSSAILDEEDFELETGNLEVQKKYLSFSNTMRIKLENIDTEKSTIFEFKHLKKLQIYRGDLNPEDLILTNSFEKIPKTCINHWEYDDDQYFLEYQETWKGIYGEFIFKKGEVFDSSKININTEKLDTGADFFEWVCTVEYNGKHRKDSKLQTGKIKKRLRTY